jgi:predicted adenylyl cyclase CyaB
MVIDNLWRNAARHWLRTAFSRFVRTKADDGHMEVERKFSVFPDEVDAVRSRIERKGFKYVGTAVMKDTFLPAAVLGEMLRIRQERIGHLPPKTLLTYKQWVTTSTGKERRETEREVRQAVALVWLAIGHWIAGGSLTGFSKKRQLFEGTLNGVPSVVSIDDVEGLGTYSGWYSEIEVLLPKDANFPEFEREILSLAGDVFGAPREPIMRSYMDMLKESLEVVEI